LCKNLVVIFAAHDNFRGRSFKSPPKRGELARLR
jgi:hypothetical protein